MAGLRKGNKQNDETKDEKDVKVEESKKAEKQEEAKEVTVKDETPKAQPQVRIKTNQDLRTIVGDQWYTFKKGVQTNVPQQVKEILAKAGMLEVL